MRWVAGFVIVSAVLGVALGFAGQVHHAGDSLALLRPLMGAICVFGLFATWSPALRSLSLVGFLAATLTIIPHFIAKPAGSDLRLYSKNLWWANTQIEAVVADISAADVDVIMLQEVSDRNNAVLGLLAEDFPFQHLCRYSTWSQIAILSRTAFDGAPQCSEARALAAAPVLIDSQKFWAVSVHIPWPWPYESADNEAKARSLLAELDAPVVLAGDFNSFPWTSRVQQIARNSETRLAGPTRSTLTLRRLPLPIDHVLAPGGGIVARRPLFGSDHRGLVADVDVW